MTWEAHWYLGNYSHHIHLGTATVHNCAGMTKGQAHVPFSFIRVCPRCGVTWSFVRVIGDTKFIPESRLCSNCGPGYIGVWEDGYDMPKEAMRYEILKLEKPEQYMSFLLTGGN